MDFLKKLFGGGNTVQNKPILDLYVRPKRCAEIVHIRIDLYNEPSLTDDGGYYVRKLARATRCPFPAEVEVYLDKSRKLQKTQVNDGELVTAFDYNAWLEAKAPRP